jgi:riboflavin synthase
MFTGIIETVAKVVALEREQGNLHITLESKIASELKVDQSVSHNGVCLTVVKIDGMHYTVTAVDETLQITNLGSLKQGSLINIERCMIMNGRLDGHIVQGHVDAVCKCLMKEENQGSWRFVFSYQPNPMHIIVEKGSICINGISLTAFHVTDASFEVAIIPYTYEHTNLHQVEVGDNLNLEFDIIGKYIARLQDFKK